MSCTRAWKRRLSLLLRNCESLRVLLVLDNLEACSKKARRWGGCVRVTRAMGSCCEQVADTAHQSCLLLTSREKPAALRALEGRRSPGALLAPLGAGGSACAQLLAEHELVGSPEEHARLAALYAGNPLASHIVAETIADLFGGAISPFLAAGTMLFGSITHLLRSNGRGSRPLEQTLLLLAGHPARAGDPRGAARGAGGEAFARTGYSKPWMGCAGAR